MTRTQKIDKKIQYVAARVLRLRILTQRPDHAFETYFLQTAERQLAALQRCKQKREELGL